MLRIRGETRVDYFWIVCEACGEHVTVKALSWDNGVPQIEFECEACEERDKLKLQGQHWLDVISR